MITPDTITGTPSEPGWYYACLPPNDVWIIGRFRGYINGKPKFILATRDGPIKEDYFYRCKFSERLAKPQTKKEFQKFDRAKPNWFKEQLSRLFYLVGLKDQL